MEGHFPPAVQEHLEEGFLQAERGELINGDEARQQIQELKSRWLRGRAPGLPPNLVE